MMPKDAASAINRLMSMEMIKASTPNQVERYILRPKGNSIAGSECKVAVKYSAFLNKPMPEMGKNWRMPSVHLASLVIYLAAKLPA